MALLINEAEVAELLTMPAAIDALDQAFRELAAGRAANQPRRRIRQGGTSLHVMSAGASALGAVGLKAYTTGRGGARFVVLLFDANDGQLLALIEADKLGQIRTGAASGVASRYMARANAKTMAIIGTGWQARTQVAAITSVRTIRQVRAYGRDPERRRRFADDVAKTLNVEVVPVESAQAAVEGADIVTTATTSAEPVLSGEWLAPGTHVNAMGSNSLIKREIDDAVIQRASVIAVDDREQALLEAGDLVHPTERGVLQWSQIRDLADVIVGRIHARTNPSDVTLFKSLGIALEDVAVGMAVYRAARERGAGREVPLFETLSQVRR